jgi:hypothetical protein
VLQIFGRMVFTGFEVKPAKARFNQPTGEVPPRLWELIVTGWGGMAALESGIKLINDCDSCGNKEYSGYTNPEKVIDETQWDGSDFFMVWPLPKYIFVTDRVEKVIREEGFKGVRIVDLKDLGPTEGFGPGRLSYYMPEARARQLGEPLGIY